MIQRVAMVGAVTIGAPIVSVVAPTPAQTVPPDPGPD